MLQRKQGAVGIRQCYEDRFLIHIKYLKIIYKFVPRKFMASCFRYQKKKNENTWQREHALKILKATNLKIQP